MAYSLEIHHIGISGGDTTMIIVRNDAVPWPRIVCKVLIDAGGETYNDSSAMLNGYLASYGAEPFDYVIASHYHADHISGFAMGRMPFRRFIDMGGYATSSEAFDPLNKPSSLTDDGATFHFYMAYVNRTDNRQNTRHNLPFLSKANYNAQGVLAANHAGPVTINLAPPSGITLTCYCAGGVLANGTNALLQNVVRRVLRQFNKPNNNLNEAGIQALADGTPITEAHLSKRGQNTFEKRVAKEMTLVSPNDLSLAFILEWGNFRYYTAGDLSSDLSLTRYANMEEPLVAYLLTRGELAANGKPITVMKATHHGSNHNNYPAQVRRAVANKKHYQGHQRGERRRRTRRHADVHQPAQPGPARRASTAHHRGVRQPDEGRAGRGIYRAGHALLRRP